MKNNKKLNFSERKLNNLIEKENKNWSKIFKKEIINLQKTDKKFSSYWWYGYYTEITKHISNKFNNLEKIKILEAGSGSGKASLLLGKNIDRTFVDISKEALKYAKLLAKNYGCKKIKYVRGNLFDLKLNSNSFNLVWNIGVLEHYSKKEIIAILKEMIRVTKTNGFISFGVPNKKSGPIIKAKLLTKPIFKLIPGYKLGTEKFYSTNELINFLKKAFKESKINLISIEIKYLGSPLPMEFSKLIIKSFGRLFSKFFKKNKFLILITAKKGEKNEK